MVAGIYKITCLTNNKIYVGSSVNLRLRFNRHRHALINNKHKNLHLQRAWNLYGKESFRFDILEKIECTDRLEEEEQYWMDVTQCYNPDIGFNKRKIADSNRGIKRELLPFFGAESPYIVDAGRQSDRAERGRLPASPLG